MGLQTEAKKGTVIEVGGVRIEVLRGSPRLEVIAPKDSDIVISQRGSHAAVPFANRNCETTIRQLDVRAED